MKTRPWYTVCPVTRGIDEIQAAELDRGHVVYPLPIGRGWRIARERKINDSRRWFPSLAEARDHVEGVLVIKIDAARAELARLEDDLQRFLKEREL